MELRNVKGNFVAAKELLEMAVEEIESRVNKKHERMAEEDLVTLRQLVLGTILIVERADGLIGQYGRAEFGSNLFSPTAKVVPAERVV